MAPTRPVLRWFGGKWMLAPWIISHFPAHRVYVEPFGGAGSVLMRKERAYAEIWNDLDGEVVNLFQVLRSADADRLIEQLRLTPFAQDEFHAAYAPTDDRLERARRLIIRSLMGFSANGANKQSTGFRADSSRSRRAPAHDWANYPDALRKVVTRLAGVVVSNADAISVMLKHDGPSTLFYVDPPYVHDTRSRPKSHCYSYEMDDEAHQALLEQLAELEGMVVLSGYPHQMYDDALAGTWQKVECVALADGAQPRTEVLWLNPACSKALADETMPMFAEASHG